MHERSKKKPEHCYHNSATAGAVNCPPWWSSTSSVMPHSSPTSSLNLNLNATRRKELHVKDLGGQHQDHGSSSTQSTGQSRHDSGIVGRGSLETNGEQLDSSTRHMVSLGNTDFLYPAEQVNFSQSVVHIPYACADPFFGGLVAAYTPQIHTQLYGVAPNRVPLPDLAEAEPIYVNAKQYHVILKRRESRAKLEAQNKLVKNRKPYLHESRHRHAMTRARGSGGRFLNTKEYQNSETNPAVDSDNGKSLALGFRRQNQIESESEVNKREIATSVGSATLSFSCVNLSDNDGGGMLRQSEKEYGAFHSHMVGNLQDGGGTLHHGTQ